MLFIQIKVYFMGRRHAMLRKFTTAAYESFVTIEVLEQQYTHFNYFLHFNCLGINKFSCFSIETPQRSIQAPISSWRDRHVHSL